MRIREKQEKADIPPRRNGLGLYVHVPFCATRCDFCAFYEETPTPARIADFFEGMELEQGLLGNTGVSDTIFWGGGTPGALSAKDLGRLGELIKKQSEGQPVEWTVEMTPVAASEARLAMLKELGVNRISIGVQSFQEGLLKALGRRHNVQQIYQAYERVRKAGFTNVNFDLMFALPGQEEALWLADLEEVFALGPEHISTYCLTLEEDTALWLKMGGRKPDLEREAAFYERTWDRLAEAGYFQYEISNFAKTGYQCRHNLNTWRMGEWVGMGPSAASQFRDERGANIANLEQWLKFLHQGKRMTEDRYLLSEALIAEDMLIFGLRMNEGVNLSSMKKQFTTLTWDRMDAVTEELLQEELITLNATHIVLTKKGRLLADAVGTALLGVFGE